MQQDGVTLGALYQGLIELFSLDDLRNLCFELGVDYESFDSQRKPSFARELILHLQRRNQLLDLANACIAKRPAHDWLSEPEISFTQRIAIPDYFWKPPNSYKNGLRNNLPQPDYNLFVGREKELLAIRHALSPNDRVWCISIDGVGGIGKSALVLEVGHRLIREHPTAMRSDRFDAVIWVSAKASSLTNNKLAPRHPLTKSLQDIFAVIAIVLDKDDLIHAHGEAQGQLIRRELSRQRTLIIVDNLESIEDESVIAFIRELPAPTKCLVTTRHRIDVSTSIRLSAMPENDALMLIAKECEVRNVILATDERKALFKRTGGVPLAMVWTIAQIGSGYSVDSVLRKLGDATGDIAQYCFANSVDAIRTKHAFTLLIALCISTYPNDRKFLGEITELSELDRDEALVDLERLSLVNRERNSYSVLPLVRDYCLKYLPTFSRQKLESIILRIGELYPPSAIDAINLAEEHIAGNELGNLREEVANLTYWQMQYWMTRGDDYGPLLCVNALTRLKANRVEGILKEVVNGLLQMGWGSANIQYAEQDAADALGRMGECDYLLNWLTDGLPYANYLDAEYIASVLKKWGNRQLAIRIEGLLGSVKDDSVRDLLSDVMKEINAKP